MLDDRNKEELYRRLAQARRLITLPLDPLTMQRLEAVALELEKQIAIVELNDTDAPETEAAVSAPIGWCNGRSGRPFMNKKLVIARKSRTSISSAPSQADTPSGAWWTGLLRPPSPWSGSAND